MRGATERKKRVETQFTEAKGNGVMGKTKDSNLIHFILWICDKISFYVKIATFLKRVEGNGS